MTAAADTARRVLDLLDVAAVDDLSSLFAPRLVGWNAAEWIETYWTAGLDTLLGGQHTRTVVDQVELAPGFFRFRLEGERGIAVAAIILDDEGRWFGASLRRREAEGIANIVLQCPWNDEREAMARLYGDLLGIDRWDIPQIVFDEGKPDDPRPRWPDPAFPQQMHLDVRVGDLEAADALVTERGATRLADFDDHRVYADVIGHPFCLYPAAGVDRPELWRLVIDGRDPAALEAFYAELLGTDTTPVLAFQHSPAEPPRWPDRAFPPQVHVDLSFDDPAPVEARILELGGSLVKPKDGYSVYADPGGHPFCIGRPGA